MAHAAFHMAIDMHVRMAINAIEKMPFIMGQLLDLPQQHDDPVSVSVIETISSWRCAEHYVGMTCSAPAICMQKECGARFAASQPLPDGGYAREHRTCLLGM
jgi:hypothetical protein